MVSTVCSPSPIRRVPVRRQQSEPVLGPPGHPPRPGVPGPRPERRLRLAESPGEVRVLEEEL